MPQKICRMAENMNKFSSCGKQLHRTSQGVIMKDLLDGPVNQQNYNHSETWRSHDLSESNQELKVFKELKKIQLSLFNYWDLQRHQHYILFSIQRSGFWQCLKTLIFKTFCSLEFGVELHVWLHCSTATTGISILNICILCRLKEWHKLERWHFSSYFSKIWNMPLKLPSWRMMGQNVFLAVHVWRNLDSAKLMISATSFLHTYINTHTHVCTLLQALTSGWL